MAENRTAKDQDQLSEKELDVVAGGADEDSGIEATDTSMSPFGDIPIGLDLPPEDIPLPDSPPPEEASDDSSEEGGVPIVDEVTEEEDGGVPIVDEVVDEITDDEDGGVPIDD